MGGAKIKSDGGGSYNKGGGGHFGTIRDSGSRIVIHKLPGLLTLQRWVPEGWGNKVTICYLVPSYDSA